MISSQEEHTLQLLFIAFNLPLSAKEIPQWRGAVIELMGLYNSDELFHNHNNNITANTPPHSPPPSTYHYRYPLIQYRVHKKHAAILAINQGVDALQEHISNTDWEMKWKGERIELKIEDIISTKHQFKLLPTEKTYQLHKWLALNQDNYVKWQACKNYIERIALLERILTAHLLALFKSFGWWLSEKLQVQLQDMDQKQWIKIHDAPMLAFNISFSANVDLPLGIAIGKSVSLGFGWIAPHSNA